MSTNDCAPETALQLLSLATDADAETLRQVASMLSHELRTPLTTIYTGSKLLRRLASGESEPRIREVASAVEADAERLMRIVEDLVIAAALPGETPMTGEPVMLQHVLPAIARAESAISPDLRLELRIPDQLPAVRGDEAYVGQALRNLVANAAQYGPPSGHVVVEARENRESVEVHVLDDGPGVLAADAPRLFRLFSRPGTERRTGGLGLGLFVCRRLVELMGGKVWLSGRQGPGADFAFSLPRYPVDER